MKCNQTYIEKATGILGQIEPFKKNECFNKDCQKLTDKTIEYIFRQISQGEQEE